MPSHYILITFHIYPKPPKRFLQSRLSSNVLYVLLISQTRITCPAHIILLDFVIIITLSAANNNYAAFSILGCYFFLLCPNILLSILSSNTANVCPSLTLIYSNTNN
jgi:hypothetical protein